ncbi:hypothetical protein [Amycolatopsis sp. lyj-23]|uniref:hypothetical protein n=1 Tax=Amycolatopsis sp. lyj-23 TaxID=2789283 RepID=UPI00397A6A22
MSTFARTAAWMALAGVSGAASRRPTAQVEPVTSGRIHDRLLQSRGGGGPMSADPVLDTRQDMRLVPAAMTCWLAALAGLLLGWWIAVVTGFGSVVSAR